MSLTIQYLLVHSFTVYIVIMCNEMFGMREGGLINPDSDANRYFTLIELLLAGFSCCKAFQSNNGFFTQVYSIYLR